MTVSLEPQPGLKEYIETRLNLITEKMRDGEILQKDALLALAESARAAAQAADLRYQQRFEAQSDALTAALQAAKEAVQAAQAAADRAVAKAEAAADKRFEALNELRQMLNDIVGTMTTRVEAGQRFDAITEKIEALGKSWTEKYEAVSKRIDDVARRFDVSMGEAQGGRQMKLDTKALIGLAITVLLALLGVATFVIARLRA